MLGLLFLETCFSALAKYAEDVNGYRFVTCQCVSGYRYSRTKVVPLVFYKACDDFLTKEGGFQGEGIKKLDYKPKCDARADIILKKASNHHRCSDLFPFLFEHVSLKVGFDDIEKLLKEGLRVEIPLGNMKDFNYLRVSILLYPYEQIKKEEEIIIKSSKLTYSILFMKLTEEIFINADKSKKDVIINNLIKLSKTPKSDFDKIYKDKKFLMVNENYKSFQKIISSLANDLKHINNYPKKSIPGRIIDDMYYSIETEYNDIKNPAGIPRQSSYDFDVHSSDPCTVSIVSGMMTDVFNIMRHSLDNSVKFNIYEAHDIGNDKGQFLPYYSFSFGFPDAKLVKKDNITIVTETQTQIDTFDSFAKENGLQVFAILNNTVEPKYNTIKINFDFNGKKLTSGPISVSKKNIQNNLNIANVMQNTKN